MLWLTAESLSCMLFFEVVTFSTLRRTGKSLGLTHTKSLWMDDYAGTASLINGAPKI